jgi:hypothetical protein
VVGKNGKKGWKGAIKRRRFQKTLEWIAILIRCAGYPDIVGHFVDSGSAPDRRHDVPFGLEVIRGPGNGHMPAFHTDMHVGSHFPDRTNDTLLQLDILWIRFPLICHIGPPPAQKSALLKWYAGFRSLSTCPKRPMNQAFICHCQFGSIARWKLRKNMIYRQDAKDGERKTKMVKTIFLV